MQLPGRTELYVGGLILLVFGILGIGFSLLVMLETYDFVRYLNEIVFGTGDNKTDFSVTLAEPAFLLINLDDNRTVFSMTFAKAAFLINSYNVYLGLLSLIHRDNSDMANIIKKLSLAASILNVMMFNILTLAAIICLSGASRNKLPNGIEENPGKL